MADQYYNPFQGIDIHVPTEFHEAYTRYCQGSGSSVVDQSPFPRMIDLWFLAACVAARLNLRPADIGAYKTVKIIDGSIFGRDAWRIPTLMLLGIAKTENIDIVAEPRKIMALVTGLAIAGLPRVVEMLGDGAAEPIWNLSDAIDEMLRGASGAGEKQ